MLNQHPETDHGNHTGHIAGPHSTRRVDGVPVTGLSRASWKYTARKAWTEFVRDECTDLAAALTYYAVLALFPALLAMVSLLGVFGQGESTTNALLDMIRQMGQDDAANQLRGPIDQMTQANAAGFALVLGILGALWSASAYIGAFGRAMNRIYAVEEGRPIWKLRPLQLAVTLVGVLLVATVLIGLVVSGPVARAVGEAIGLGASAVTLWNVMKWPVILAIVIVLVAMLYYSTPNVRKPKFQWISVGATVAILTWILASVGFAFYVANFGSYNKTYGSLAGRHRVPALALADESRSPLRRGARCRAGAHRTARGRRRSRGGAQAHAPRHAGIREAAAPARRPRRGGSKDPPRRGSEERRRCSLRGSHEGSMTPGSGLRGVDAGAAEAPTEDRRVMVSRRRSPHGWRTIKTAAEPARRADPDVFGALDPAPSAAPWTRTRRKVVRS